MSIALDVVTPNLKPEEKTALREFFRFYEPNSAAIGADLRRACEAIPELAAIMRAMTPEQIEMQDRRSLALQRAALIEDHWVPYLEDMREQGALYARMGVAFATWFEILSIYRQAMLERMVVIASSELERAALISRGLSRLLDIAMANIGEAYLATKEQIISRQQEAIRELSTPVLQVRDRLLIIPVVGLVDTHRARLLTEGLLTAIRERRAKGVVMDITGVPMVDSKVANHLAQACEAARLMGAMVVMTGIASEIAQTLVTIGAKLEGVRTLIDLQDGIEYVERYLGYRPAADAPALEEL